MVKKLIWLAAGCVVGFFLLLNTFYTDYVVLRYGKEIQREMWVEVEDIVVVDHKVMVELYYEWTGVKENDIAGALHDGIVYISRDANLRRNENESEKHAVVRCIAHECQHYIQKTEGRLRVPKDYYTDDDAYRDCDLEIEANEVGNDIADKVVKEWK